MPTKRPQKLYSSSEAAVLIGCHHSTIYRWAVSRKRKIGVVVAGRLLFMTDDIKALRAVVRRAPGNPNFSAGNYFGQPRTA